MAQWRPDPSFYPSPKMAMRAPREQLAYVAALRAPGDQRPDAMTVVDVDPNSSTVGKIVNTLPMPNVGDELHHFGWNACSSALCPYAPHPHIERRYLIVPGLRSSRIYVLDTKPDPRQPRIVKTIEPETVADRTGYTRPHTVHCGPDGIYMSALGSPEGKGPGGVFILDHYNFEPLGRWEVERGPQQFAYDFWWHLGYDTMVTSEWGTPDMFEDGLIPEKLLASEYGRHLHFWDLHRRRHLQAIDVGPTQQLVFELRPAHDPTKAYGFVGVVLSLENLSSSVWVWYRENGQWAIRKVIEVPAEPADPAVLPPMLKGFGAVAPLLTDINLSLDDRFLYLSCWGTGELLQYDVSDPFNPKKTGSVHIGGIAREAAHPSRPDQPLNGGPQMVEVSRDGRRIYFTNSLYSRIDEQFYPAGLKNWMVQVDAAPDGGIELNRDFFVDFGEYRAHQVRLQDGDSSSDSYCFP